VLHGGGAAPVKWIGWRKLPAAQVTQAGNAPICILAGAFGPNRPHRDLWVSPDHAIGAHGVLIPARALVNWVTIFRDQTAREVTYFHVELDQHALLISEGLATESYLEWEDNRSFFTNGPLTIVLRPDLEHAVCLTRGCRPRYDEGPVVDEVRRQLAARAVEMQAAAQTPRDAQDVA
jgi:hypothetical protein